MKLIKRGDRGNRVKLLQEALVRVGLLPNTPTSVDGGFGPLTETAVIDFQKANNLIVDGRVGDATATALGMRRGHTLEDWRMTQIAMVACAGELGIELATLHAISEVESNGAGFHPNGIIKVLYERHIFRRVALAQRLDLLVKMVSADRPDLCNVERGGYRGGLHENTRLEMAKRFHREVGLSAASYGRFQILGMHWEVLGYDSPDKMVEHAEISENAQLDQLSLFIRKDSRLLKAARERDFSTFANIYNGTAHQGYDVKMQQAYTRFAQITK